MSAATKARCLWGFVGLEIVVAIAVISVTLVDIDWLAQRSQCNYNECDTGQIKFVVVLYLVLSAVSLFFLVRMARQAAAEAAEEPSE